MPAVVQPGITGTKQDIADYVMLYRAEDWPFLGAAKKEGPPKQEIHQYQDGERLKVDKRGVRDGTDVGEFTRNEDRTIIETNAHWMRANYAVGKKAQTFTEVAGRKNLRANEVEAAISMLKTGIAEVLLDNVDQRDEGANGSETRGMGSWMSATAQATRPVPAGSRPVAGQLFSGAALSTLKESHFKNILAELWKITRRKKRYMGWCGIGLKGHVSDWSTHFPDKTSHATVRSFDQKAEAKRFAAIINILEFDGGTVELHLEPNLLKSRDGGVEMSAEGNRSAFVMDMDDGYSIKWAQKPEHMALPDQGGGPRGCVDAIFAAKCFPKLHGAILPNG